MKRNNKPVRLLMIYSLLLSLALGQSNGYLAQKLMIENSLRNRISDAMEKVIDNRKYVIDVSVDLEVSSAIESKQLFHQMKDRCNHCSRPETLLLLAMLQLVAVLVFQYQVLILQQKLPKPLRQLTLSQKWILQ